MMHGHMNAKNVNWLTEYFLTMNEMEDFMVLKFRL